MLLKFFIHLSQLVLFAERLWAAFAVPFLWCAGLLITGAWGVWALLPFGLHLALLGAWVGVILWSFYRCWGQFLGVPSFQEGRVALERRHGLAHRPITLLADKPATKLTPQAQALWDKAQQKAAQKAQKAGPVGVHTQRIAADRWALRYAALLLLFLALWADGGRGFMGLEQTFYPVGKQAFLKTIQGVDVFFEPPAYTGISGFSLQHQGQERLPENSLVQAQIHVAEALAKAPTISLKGASTHLAVPLVLEGKTYKGQVHLTQEGVLSLRYKGRVLHETHIEITPDEPPKINLSGALERTPEGMLNIPFKGADDYGIEKVNVVLSRDERTITQELVLPQKGIKEVNTSSYVDFTPDIFSGLVVDFTLEATDAAGQKTVTKVRKVKLPERVFHHPVAKKLVALRRTLFTNSGHKQVVATQLKGLMAKPEDFDHNNRAYLSMGFAYQTLTAAQSGFLERSMGLLWDGALHIEKGPLALQMERLLNAQRDLQKAIAQGANSAEVNALFRRLAQAMGDLLRQAKFSGEELEGMMGVPSLQNADLAHLMARIDQLLKSGAYQEAQKLLKELEALMAHVSTGGGQPLEAFKKAFEDLENIKQQQKELIEEAFNNPIPGRMSAQQQLKQQALAEKLMQTTKTLKDLGFDTADLEKASKVMATASGIAGEEGLEAFVNHLQNRALQMIKTQQQRMAQQLQQQMGFGGLSGFRRDPSGKLHSVQEDVVLPDEAPETVARRIRDMLFERAGQLRGSEEEHRYLRRLLEGF